MNNLIPQFTDFTIVVDNLTLTFDNPIQYFASWIRWHKHICSNIWDLMLALPYNVYTHAYIYIYIYITWYMSAITRNLAHHHLSYGTLFDALWLLLFPALSAWWLFVNVWFKHLSEWLFQHLLEECAYLFKKKLDCLKVTICYLNH